MLRKASPPGLRRTTILTRAPLASVGIAMVGFGLLADVLAGTTIGFGVAQLGAVALGVAIVAASLWLPLRALSRLYLASISGLAVIFGVEMACRALLPIPKIDLAVRAGPPGREMVLNSAPDNFTAVHRYNSLGFRGPDFSIEPDKANRIICIGDSWTEGIGAEEQQTWPSVLQRNLPDATCEVLNLGDAGSAPDRYLRIFAEVAVPLHPTHVMICIIPSDLVGGPIVPRDLVVRERLQDTFRERGNSVASVIAPILPGWMYLWDGARGRRAGTRNKFWAAWDQRRENMMIDEIRTRERVSLMRAREIAADRMSHILPACIDAAQHGDYNSARIALEVVRPDTCHKGRVADMEIPEDDLVACTREWLKWYHEACRARKITPIIVFFPEPGLVSDTPNGPKSDEDSADRPIESQDESVSKLLLLLCDEIGCKFIDCTPVLREYQGDQPLFLRYDSHPTAKAYEIAGQYMAQVLKQDVLNCSD